MIDLKIYIAVHKPIENEIPSNKDVYVLCHQFRTIIDDRLPIIYIDDEFTKKHNISYGEGCLMHYLWKHQDELPDYIGLAHYRRFFDEFVGNEEKIETILKDKKAIIHKAFVHKHHKTNYFVSREMHIRENCDVIKYIVDTKFNEYKDAFDEMEKSDKQYVCNMFIMPKKDFIEMCEFVFGVLFEFDRFMEFNSDEDVSKYVRNQYRANYHLYGNPKWQSRLQGFYLEWLTETFFRKQFGIENCYQADSIVREPSVKLIKTDKTINDVRNKLKKQSKPLIRKRF